MSGAPEFVRTFPDRATEWWAGLMSPKWFGFFAACADSVIEYDFETSAKAVLVLSRLHGVEALPGHSAEAIEHTVEFLHGQQDPETGFFVDPMIESIAGDLDNDTLISLRKNKSKYAQILIEFFGSSLRQPYYTTGTGGAPDVDWAMDRVRNGFDGYTWEERPNAVGNMACALIRELFNLACEGQTQYLPAVKAGLDRVMAHQNPRTGMWGSDPIPRAAQVQAALKIIGRLKWSFGLEIPYLEQMADVCIDWHADGSFYHHEGGGVSHCDPRNVAEMIYVCLLDRPDYRADEMAATLTDVCRYYEEVHGTPDGAYSRGRGTEAVIYNKVAVVAPATDSPRADLGGTNGASYTYGMANEALSWGVPNLKSPHAGWEQGVASRPYRVVLQDDRTVEVEAVEGAAAAG